ncbi:hypothetical protein BJX62DRAFT_232631 [Aspergillus germanicus]
MKNYLEGKNQNDLEYSSPFNNFGTVFITSLGTIPNPFILAIIIAVITPYLVGTNPGDANLGAKVFFIWGGLCCVSLVFAYFLVPEIKGLSLKRVDKMLEEVPPRQGSKWVPHSTFAGEMGLADAKEDVQAENAEDVKL